MANWRLFFGRSEINENEAALFDHGKGRLPVTLHEAIIGGVRHVDYRSFDIEFPPMEDAAESALFDPAKAQ